MFWVFLLFSRGARCSRTKINEEMKVAAVHAIKDLAKESVAQDVVDAYGGEALSYGKDYIIPKPLDSRLLGVVSAAVAKAAVDSVARYGYPEHYPLKSTEDVK